MRHLGLSIEVDQMVWQCPDVCVMDAGVKVRVLQLAFLQCLHELDQVLRHLLDLVVLLLPGTGTALHLVVVAVKGHSLEDLSCQSPCDGMQTQ